MGSIEFLFTNYLVLLSSKTRSTNSSIASKYHKNITSVFRQCGNYLRFGEGSSPSHGSSGRKSAILNIGGKSSLGYELRN